MHLRPRTLWIAFLRLLILILAGLCILGIYLWRSPNVLRRLMLAAPLPGLAEFPSLGPTPLPPHIDAPPGAPPTGPLALRGDANGLAFGCGFLLELDSGQVVGVSAAHATQPMSRSAPGQLRAGDSSLSTSLSGQLAIGQAFMHNAFSMDYAFWALSGPPATHPLRADTRGSAQPGERIWVLQDAGDGAGGSKRWPGVVLSVEAEAAWVRLDDSFYPGGFSGCPVISQITGRLVGMAVAGADQPPVVMGLHPASSLVEKAGAALKRQ
jgi:hypothetical protein